MAAKFRGAPKLRIQAYLRLVAWAASCSLAATGLCLSLRQPHSEKPLRVGIDHAPPYQMLRADGGVEGLSVAMIREAAKRRKLSVIWIPVRGNQSMMPSVGSGRPLAGRSAERGTKELACGD